MRRLILITAMLVAWTSTPYAQSAPKDSLGYSTEPAIAFSYGYRLNPNLTISLILMNEEAARVNLGRESWGREALVVRDSLSKIESKKIQIPIMLLTVIVDNLASSRDTLTFPGDAEICIVHDGRYLTALLPVPDIDIAPGQRAVLFLVFRRYPMIEGDTLAIRPKESP